MARELGLMAEIDLAAMRAAVDLKLRLRAAGMPNKVVSMNASAEGILVHKLGCIGNVTIDFDNFAVDRRVELADRFGRLDLATNLHVCGLCANLRQVYENNVAELLSRVGGNADGRNVALNLEPLVFFCVAKIGWIRHDGLVLSLVKRQFHDFVGL
jgi:hypothetical protein